MGTVKPQGMLVTNEEDSCALNIQTLRSKTPRNQCDERGSKETFLSRQVCTQKWRQAALANIDLSASSGLR